MSSVKVLLVVPKKFSERYSDESTMFATGFWQKNLKFIIGDDAILSYQMRLVFLLIVSRL